MTLIGLTGHIDSGKTTIAKYLVRTYKFVKLSFSQELKTMLVKSGIVSPEEMRQKTPYARRMLQLIGTNLIRDMIDKDFWVKKLDEKINVLVKRNTQRIVIDDVRFPNEAEYIKNKGGILIRVKRKVDTNPGFLGHESEKYIPHLDVDYEIDNSESILITFREVDRLMRIILQA